MCVLKLLRFLHDKVKRVQIKGQNFQSEKLEQLMKRQFLDPIQLLAGDLNDHWVKGICQNASFMISRQTRNMYFKLSTFDKQRSLSFLALLMKGSPGTMPELKSPQLPRCKIKVNRKAILDCGIKVMQSQSRSRSLLEFDFFDEVGSGLGPTMEFYSLSSTAIKELDFLWRATDQGTLFPAPLNPSNMEGGIKGMSTHKITQIFKYMGWLIARSILDDRLVDLPVDPAFWELALGEKLNLYDIGRIDSRNGNFFIELEKLIKKKSAIEEDLTLNEDQKKRQIESITIGDGYKLCDLGLVFTLQGYDSIELKPGGSNISLNISNLKEYLDLTILNTFYTTIAPQVFAFREGFNLVFPIDSLKYFTSSELEDLICGEKGENWAVDILSEDINTSLGYDKSSPQYLFLLQYIAKLNKPMQRLFLQYVTGSPRLPYGGFSKLTPKMSIGKRICPQGANPNDYLPSVMTCQNLLKIPEYTSYEVLQSKFDYAIKEGQNSFTLS